MLDDAFVMLALAFLLLAGLCALVIYQSFVIEKLEGRIARYRRVEVLRKTREKPQTEKVVRLSEATNRRRRTG